MDRRERLAVFAGRLALAVTLMLTSLQAASAASGPGSGGGGRDDSSRREDSRSGGRDDRGGSGRDDSRGGGRNDRGGGSRDDRNGGAREGRGSEQDTARDAVKNGAALPLSQVLPTVKAAAPGSVLGVNLTNGGGRWIYAITVLSPDGRYRDVKVDAARNRILEMKWR